MTEWTHPLLGSDPEHRSQVWKSRVCFLEWSGALCNALAWFRTLSLHTPPLCNKYCAAWTYVSGAPDLVLAWGPVQNRSRGPATKL
jgi:hypothetical protein